MVSQAYTPRGHKLNNDGASFFVQGKAQNVSIATYGHILQRRIVQKKA